MKAPTLTQKLGHLLRRVGAEAKTKGIPPRTLGALAAEEAVKHGLSPEDSRLALAYIAIGYLNEQI